MSERRILALHLPRFAAERAIRREPALAGGPLALWAREGPRRLVTAVNDHAAAEIVPGTPLADALAVLPGLVARPADPAGDDAALGALAAWCLGFAPLAAPAPPDGVVLDITGCAHLWGGEAALLAVVATRVRRAGFTAHAAIAGTAAGALALARAGRNGVIVPPGEQGRAVADLPLAALRPDPALAALAERLGLRRIGDLAAQRRGPLARRLGPRMLARIDEALGRAHHPITPVRPPPPARAVLDCPEPVATAEAIAAGIERLTAELCADLAARGQGARRLTLACFRTDATVQRLGIGTGAASRDPAHLARLLLPRIERIDPGFGIERLVLAAEMVEPLGAVQGGLPGSAAAAASRREELARLLDRLRARLGEAAVRRLDPVPNHWPEAAMRPADPLAPVRPLPWRGRPRPLRLLHPPRRIDALSVLPDGPPVRLGTMRVCRAEGPERILPAWWMPGVQEGARDYWRVETEDGRRLWVFAHRKDGAPEWFVHGWFG
ncbi:DNA polymerase Y family protein [Elioraea sp.]|uniref:Y-family DNA polymerase n=1 Tax=Elioraea sp. TaxID=2185103 RepID=UPI00307D9A01